jgi:hypothetical protein
MMNILIIRSLVNIIDDEYFILVNIMLFSANGVAAYNIFCHISPQKEQWNKGCV